MAAGSTIGSKRVLVLSFSTVCFPRSIRSCCTREFTAFNSVFIGCSHDAFRMRSTIGSSESKRSCFVCSTAAEIQSGFEGLLNKQANNT